MDGRVSPMGTEGASNVGAAARWATYRSRYWPARLRVLRRLALLALWVMLLGVFAVGLRRTTGMIGLPDVGEPFGSASPRAVEAVGMDVESALAPFRGAIDRLEPPPGGIRDRLARSDLRAFWSESPPALARWVEANGEAVERFRRAADGPGRIDGNDPAAAPRQPGAALVRFVDLIRLAQLEALRREDRGDMAGAWGWHLAALRSTYHLGRRGNESAQIMAPWLRGPVVASIRAWAEDPRVDAGGLRRALDDLAAAEALAPSELELLEGVYRQTLRELGTVHGGGRWMDLDGRAFGFDDRLPPNLAHAYWEVRRFLDDEPERSRRVVRLAFANWRAWLAQPAGGRARPAIRSVVRHRGQTIGVEFFPAGAGAPAAARRLSPRRLADWFETTCDARVPLATSWSQFRGLHAQERGAHAALVVHLAEQLYLRERGALPPTPEALVGLYLKALPDDGSSELDDGTTPTTGRE